jgi:hypothetical protein
LQLTQAQAAGDPVEADYQTSQTTYHAALEKPRRAGSAITRTAGLTGDRRPNLENPRDFG